jgi:hypothetical protein
MLDPIKSAASAFTRFFGLFVLSGICFLAFYAGGIAAETNSPLTVAVSPTPAKKPAPTPTPKKPVASSTPKPGPKPASKPSATPGPKTETAKVIVSVTGARVRSEATTSSTEIRKFKLGMIVPVLDKTMGAGFWYKVQLPAGSKPGAGWMSSTVVNSFDPAKAESVYRDLVQKNFKKDSMSFSDASEVYEFLTRIVPEIKTPATAAEFSLKRLQALAAALDKIPIVKSDDKVYKNFTTAQDKFIVYSDPAGQYFVRAELFWDLHKKYKGTVIGEEIAWSGARTYLPGECEGYVVCYLYNMRETDGTYLENYPDGKHSAEALKNIIAYMEPMANDTKDKSIYTGPSDLSDRAEFNRLLSELRGIVSKVPFVDKDKALQQIAKMAEIYR